MGTDQTKTTVRFARPEDLRALADIYNHEVVHGTATLDLDPQPLEERRRWMEAHPGGRHPLIVAEENGQVAGYASLSPYREKQAYATTVELSVYVGAGHRGRGVGRALMETVLEIARSREDVHCVVSVITAGNGASEALHRRFGFEFCGTVPQAAYKLGAWRSVDTWALVVGEKAGEPTDAHG